VKNKYHWPTKLKKFGIEDPFLKILVAKYENQIPWQVKVKDEDSLRGFVQQTMLPRVLNRVEFPPKRSVKHYFVSERNVDIDAALTTDQELDKTDIGVIELIREEDGIDEAKRALAELVNARKAAAFRQWIDLITEQYHSDTAFVLLLLRPLFDMAGRGSRCSVVPPSTDIVDWLYRRIVQGRLSPNDNVARVYCWKLSAGTQKIPVNGWQYIPMGSQYAHQLAAACRGSGWCVASYEWASSYLSEGSCFYILRNRGRPEVALRIDESGLTVVECQGRYNESPDGWFQDIALFLRTQNLGLRDRVQEMESALDYIGNFNTKSLEWWLERARLWPFSVQLAPKTITAQASTQASMEIAYYLGFPAFQSLAERAGVAMEPKDWIQAIEINPARFAHCPQEYRETGELKSACVRGWVDRILDGEITLGDIASVDEFVRQHPAFIETLQQNFPGDLKALIRRPPRTAAERLNRFDLETLLPTVSDEPAAFSVERAVNSLLNNEIADFSDKVFPTVIRERDDFAAIRECAWLEAMNAHPPLWFALPEDLKSGNSFEITEGEVGRVDLDAWVLKVEQSPWLLTQQKGVPKSVRFHRRILEAYREGWLPYLKKTPWRIWVKRGLYRRVYMSYGLLGEARVADAFTEGWRTHKKKVFSYWSKGSARMRNMPALQFSVLRAVCSRNEIMSNGEVLRVCLDIRDRQPDPKSTICDEPYVEEIRNRLNRVGLGKTGSLVRLST